MGSGVAVCDDGRKFGCSVVNGDIVSYHTITAGSNEVLSTERPRDQILRSESSRRQKYYLLAIRRSLALLVVLILIGLETVLHKEYSITERMGWDAVWFYCSCHAPHPIAFSHYREQSTEAVHLDQSTLRIQVFHTISLIHLK